MKSSQPLLLLSSLSECERLVAGRTTAQAVVEGLIVLAAVILGVVTVYALVS